VSETLEAETVILAIGQQADLSFLKPEDGIEITSQGALSAETLTVTPKGPLRSIPAAIREANPGDTVHITAGVYPGNLLLDKRITLEGEGTAVVHGDGYGSVITVTADGCVIRGLILEHSGPMLVSEDSGILLKSNHNRIEHNQLRDVLFGIYLFHSEDNIVADNFICGRPWLDPGERGSGIHIWNSLGNTILRNVITLARDGMYLQNSSRRLIVGNRVYDLRYGLHYMFSDDNRFEENRFYDNVAGAAIMYSHRIQFRRNAFVRNRGFSSFGILFQDSSDCLAEENTIVDNAVGIFMEALRDSVFRRNILGANDLAMQIFSSATGDTFRDNNFAANLSPIEVIGRRTDVRWDGNYWSDYSGYDLNSDGIGDVPHRIQNVFQHLEGNYPRVRIYLFSPAAQALAASERAFPVIERSREFDHAPLMHPVRVPVLEADRGTPRRRSWGLASSAALVSGSLLLAAWGARR